MSRHPHVPELIRHAIVQELAYSLVIPVAERYRLNSRTVWRIGKDAGLEMSLLAQHARVRAYTSGPGSVVAVGPVPVATAELVRRRCGRCWAPSVVALDQPCPVCGA